MKGTDALNLDDISQTVFCIPYQPEDDDEQEDQVPKQSLLPRIYQERDLKDGQELRLAAYKASWKKGLDRMQDIIQDLQRSTVKAVVEEVRQSYVNVLPGLPYPELPTVSIINPSLGSTLMDSIAAGLEEEMEGSDAKCSTVHLYPGDFLNLQAGMRAIILGFIDGDDKMDQGKRKPSASLASYDIKYLASWYKSRTETKDNFKRLNLVVILHDFEQFDPFIMQDVLHICSGASSLLPLVFILSMSSPVQNFLNLTYPRSTLSLLRVRYFTAPSGVKILQEIIFKTFFDVEFEPDIMIGPSILEYLQDYFNRYNSSVDVILTILQLAHLRHFNSDPLAVLVHGTPSSEALSESASAGFLEALESRTALIQTKSDNDMDVDNALRPTSSSDIVAVDRSRGQFYSKARGIRVGFCIMARVQSQLEKHGHKGLDWSLDNEKRGGLCDAILALLSGRFTRDIKHLTLIVKKLKEDELQSLLETLTSFFHDLPAHARSAEQEDRNQLIMLLANLENKRSASTEVATKLSDWMADYLGSKLVVLEEADLWDVWYTGLAPFPSELLNPSIRGSMVAGLLRPHEYAIDFLEKPADSQASKSLWELPDTSILFKRYLDSGKMINIYDWFESFKSVLDMQRVHLQEEAAETINITPVSSPRKRGKGKSKKKEKPIEMTEEEEEKWKVEIQARFVRAMQELDYLGFIKHTGRKADHVLRTVFEIDDAE